MEAPQERHVEVDERWIGDWLEFGFSELTQYLDRHARFDAYCETNHRSR